ncbi:energy-coupling factor transporter transmembrane component T, partial [Thermobrachium celere]|uniref:energy-coupling factor transporter transmembrane component T n=1 Tax=Thermobrachium celere TaxID=53422 RepID=UPI001944DF48
KKRRIILVTIKVFLPLIIITILINMFFSSAGVVVLFRLFNKYVTLENLIYSVLFAVKLLIIIYAFYIMEMLIDSDSALTFILSKMPKTGLIFMVCLKLIPTMKNKLKDLKDIYLIRGVEFESKSRFERIKAQIPLMMVLIEESLESSFDIAESSYVRGFLSGRRSIFNKKKFKLVDYAISILSLVAFILVLLFRKIIDYNAYEDYRLSLNLETLVITFMIFLLTAVINYYYKENRYAD